MTQNVFSLFAIPTYLKLIFVALFCLVVLCNCGSPSVSSKPPADIRIFEPNPTPEPVPIVDFNDTELGKQIRQDYFQRLDNAYGNIKFEDVYVRKLYGAYNDSIAVLMWIYGFDPPPAIVTIEVEGSEFHFHSGRPIMVWNNGNFYSLQSAYDEGLVSMENLEQIHSLHTLN